MSIVMNPGKEIVLDIVSFLESRYWHKDKHMWCDKIACILITYFRQALLFKKLLKNNNLYLNY